MKNRIRRSAVTLGVLTGVLAAPMAVATIATPAVSWACPVGQVPQGGGCAAYCPPGALLDTQSGSCVQPAAAPAPPPPPPAPAWNGDITPFFSVCAGVPTPIPFVGINACI